VRTSTIAVVVNAPEEVKPDQTTGMLIHGLLTRGHRVVVGGVAGLEVDDTQQVFMRGVDAIQGQDVALTVSSLRAMSRRIDLTTVAGVWLRTNPGRDPRFWAHRTTTDLLRLVRDAGVVVLNDPDGLAKAGSKLYLQHLPPEVRPRTLISHDRQALEAFVRQAPGPVVLKPLYGSRGQDVFKVSARDENLRQITDFLTREGHAMAQDYVPEAAQGDTRVLLLEGEILMAQGHAAAIRRVPPSNDFRSNVFQGGHAEPGELTATMTRIAAAIGPRLRADGLFLAGMDLIGDRIVELNVFSPGGLADANDFAGVDFITPLIDAFERRLKGPS
jgi:glutathione synthase